MLRGTCASLHNGKYLFNEFNLATVFRAKFLAALRQSRFTVPDSIPKKWIVDCKHVGRGLSAIKYLSRYLYRGVMSEKNVIDDDGVYVTFRYRESKSGEWKTRCVIVQGCTGAAKHMDVRERPKENCSYG